MLAKLVLSDGTEIEISEQTEVELRKVFGKLPVVPYYKDSCMKVIVNPKNPCFPILVEAGVTQDVGDIKSFIVALQEAVTYCEQNDLGV